MVFFVKKTKKLTRIEEEQVNIYYVMAKYIHIQPSEVDKMPVEIVYALIDTYQKDMKEQEREMNNAKSRP